MPQFNTGNAQWDQGLGSLSSIMFPDASKIAQAGLYGAQARAAGLAGDLQQRQLNARGGLASMLTSSIPQRFGGTAANVPPGAAAPPGAAPIVQPSVQTPGPPVVPPGTVGATGPQLGPAQTQNVVPLASLIAPGGNTNQKGLLATGTPPPTVSPGGGAPPGQTNTGSDGSVPNDNQGDGLLHPGSLQQPGGGVKMSPPAQADGSPAPVAFDLGKMISLAVDAGYDGPQLTAIVGAYIAKGVQSGVLDQHTANQLLLDMNPAESGAMQRQQYITGSTPTPVYDLTTHQTSVVPYNEAIANPGRYQMTTTTNYDVQKAPGQAYDPKNPFRPVQRSQEDITNRNMTPVTRNAPEIWGAGVAGAQTPPTPKQTGQAYQGMGFGPPGSVDAQQQNLNAGIDNQVVQKAFGPVAGDPYANKDPVYLNDPYSLVARTADQLQRTNKSLTREQATAQAIDSLRASGQIKYDPQDRATTRVSRNTPYILGGQPGGNPHVITRKVKDKSGKLVDQNFFQVDVLPNPQGGAPGQQGGGAQQPGQGGQQPAGQQERVVLNGPSKRPENTVVRNPAGPTRPPLIVHGGRYHEMTPQEVHQWTQQRAQK